MGMEYLNSPVAAKAVDCDGLSLSAGLARSAIPANTRPFNKNSATSSIGAIITYIINYFSLRKN